MDDQYQQLPPGYGSPGETGTVLQPRQNPYQLAAPQVQQPVAQQQPGLFDSMPYHQWLAKNVKNPWEATDDDLTGKHFSSYIDGPIKSLIKAHLANGNKEISKAALDDRADAIAEGLKIQKQSEVGANLSSLKQHLQGLAPKDGQQQQTADPSLLESAGNALQKGIHTTLGLAAQGLGSLPYAVNRLSNPVAPPEAIEAGVNENDLTRQWQDYLFGIAGKESDAAAKVGGPGKDFLSKALYTAGSLPSAIATGGMGDALNSARSDIAKGKDLGEVKKNLAVDAATNLLLSRVPGGGVLARAAKGAALNPVLQNASAVLKGEATPDMQDNVLSAIFGAGFAAALGRKPGSAEATVPPAGEATPEGEFTPNKPGDLTPEELKGGADAAAKNAALAAEHASKFTPQAIASDVADAESPAAAQAHFNELTKGIPPEQHQAAADAYNTVRGDIHGNEAAQVKPVQAQPATQSAEVPADQGTTDTAAELPAVKTAENAAPKKAAAAPETAPETPKGTVASTKSGVAAMLAEPVRAPILKSGKQVGSTELNFASETDKLGYLHANADAETKPLIAEQLRARGVRYPDAFSTQVQAQVKAKTKSNGLKSVSTKTSIGVIVPHVMQGIPLPKMGSGAKRAAPEPVLKNAPPERRAKIQRGVNGSVDVEFATPEDKELFSAIGRDRNSLMGKAGIAPRWDRLAQLYNTDHAGAYALAKGFRDRVINAVKGLEEGSVYKAETARPKAKPR